MYALSMWKGLIPSVWMVCRSDRVVPKHQSVFVAPLSAISIIGMFQFFVYQNKDTKKTGCIQKIHDILKEAYIKNHGISSMKEIP